MISLQAICHFNLASKVSARGGHATFKEISLGTGLNESTVRRLLRHAMSYRIFHETENGTVAHTGASKYLAEKADMRSWIGMVSEEMWPAATKVRYLLSKN